MRKPVPWSKDGRKFVSSMKTYEGCGGLGRILVLAKNRRKGKGKKVQKTRGDVRAARSGNSAGDTDKYLQVATGFWAKR